MFASFKFIIFTSFFLLFTACNSVDPNSQNSYIDASSDSNLIRVACVGDSITEGVGLSTDETYPVQLEAMLGDGYEVRNFGKQSTTVMKNGSAPYWNTSEFAASLDYAPDIVVIMFGTNDARPENWENNSSFIADYEELIDTYSKLPSQPIVYISYPPPIYDVVYGITNERIINEVIPAIRQVAINTNLTVIDNYSALFNKISLFPDMLHPNAEGARIIAEQVYRTIY